MKQKIIFILGMIGMTGSALRAMNFIPANHPAIRYEGRWDLTDSLHPRHSWPGAAVSTAFTGTSIGVRLADSINYYNVVIDGAFVKVFHGTQSGDADYPLARGLASGRHTLRFSKRNIVFDAVFSFSGFLLDDGAKILDLPDTTTRRIEFIGDSFTAAESNEATVQQLPWEERFPVTNIDKGFAAEIARHFNADYHTTCRSGSGMVCDWRGDTTGTIPAIFDRALMEAAQPKWNFAQWIPQVAVICLGLNDHSGLKSADGTVPESKSEFFRTGYRKFLRRLREVYPGVRIFAVAAPPNWIRENVLRIVEEERAAGAADIYFGTFDEYPGGYVANGHPTVETHRKIAGQLIREMEQLKLFSTTKE